MRHPHLDTERAANLAENPYAGQGSVLLDLGESVGALVVHLPPSLEGAEVEITPVGQGAAEADQQHPHEHGHEHGHEHPHEHPHRRHVAVVGRPAGGRVAYTAVFPELEAGGYELTIRDEPARLYVDVAGGRVTEVGWLVQ